MKRILHCVSITALSLLLAALSVFGCCAADVDLSYEGKTVVTYGDWILERINHDTQWELDEYIGSSEHIIVPRFIDDLLVVSIGSYCFVNNTTVKSVVTSSPLWTVDDYAFVNCTSLESFECNYALRTIGVAAFSGATSLTSINLEDSVITAIAEHTFTNTALVEVELPSTCTSIGEHAFYNCSSLTKITVPNSVTNIADNAFEGCSNVVIYCYSGSAAHNFARSKGISFVLLDAQPETFLLGDADGSDDVDVIDATWVQRCDAEMNITPVIDTIMQGDVDGDGMPDVIDAAFIMRYAVSIPTPYAIGEPVTK